MTQRIIRGGSWVSYVWLVRAACHCAGRPGSWFDVLGFRIVKEDR